VTPWLASKVGYHLRPDPGAATPAASDDNVGVMKAATLQVFRATRLESSAPLSRKRLAISIRAANDLQTCRTMLSTHA
jgi:hypothetical protein